MYMLENLLEEIINMNSVKPNKIMKETNETFDYYIALPGLNREDLEIKAMLEKDFITIFVKIKKESNFVSEQSIRIVKLINEVLTEEDSIAIIMENGVLKISLTKTNPITEFKL